MSYLTTDLVSDVQIAAGIPDNQGTFTDTVVYAIGDREIRSKMLPLIMKNLEEYYIVILDYNVTANQAAYQIPTRAVAAGLRDVQLVQSNDDEARTPLERLSPEDLYSTVGGNYRFTIKKNGFYLQGNQVVVYPTPTTTQNLLRLSYACRPNKLVDPTACGQVLSIDLSTNTVVLSASAPSTFAVNTLMDLVNANPNFDWWAQDLALTAITTTTVQNDTLTFTTLPSSLNVGDYVCLSGQSCVVQVPVELQPLLVQYIAVRILSAQGDEQSLRDAVSELKMLEDNALLMIAPRVEGKPKRCVNTRSLTRFV